MGRRCILCARVRRNEAFGGRAERARMDRFGGCVGWVGRVFAEIGQ